MAMSTLGVQHAAIGAKRPIALLRCSQSLLVTGFLQYLPKDTKELPQWEGPWFSSLHCCGCVVTVDFFARQNCRIVLVQVPALAHISHDNLGKLTSLVANQSCRLWQINPLTGSPKAAGSAIQLSLHRSRQWILVGSLGMPVIKIQASSKKMWHKRRSHAFHLTLFVDQGWTREEVNPDMKCQHQVSPLRHILLFEAKLYRCYHLSEERHKPHTNTERMSPA